MDEYWFAMQAQENFEFVTKESVFAKWFRNVKVNRFINFVTSNWSPVTEPYKDNVLLVGDSAWYGEAEITGSMMCGWRAANAITVALRDNKPNREGVLNFIEWWKKSYPQFDDYRNFVMFFFLRLIFSEQELNYLYGLFKEPLRSTLNPFLIVRLIKKGIEPMMAKAEQEMPSLVEKLNKLEIENVDKMLSDLKKS